MKIVWVLVGLLIPITIVALPITFASIRRSARKGEPVSRGAILEFTLGRGMRFLIGFVLILLAVFTMLVFFASLSAGGSLFVVLIPAVVLIAIALAIPHAVVLDDTGIRQHRWLVADRHAAWADIATVTRGPNTGRTFVWSKEGEIVAVLSPLSIGQHRFEKEIRARAKDVVFEIK